MEPGRLCVNILRTEYHSVEENRGSLKWEMGKIKKSNDADKLEDPTHLCNFQAPGSVRPAGPCMV